MKSNSEIRKWERLERQAHLEAAAELHKQHKAGIFDDGDPNHPKYNNGINYATGLPVNLFGYDTQEFLARQYRKEGV